MSEIVESGTEFEHRGIALARALHDPMGVQGAVVFNGRERDGLFVSHDEINAYEFTVDVKRDKAVKDGEKLVELLRAVGSLGGNSYKPRTGWFVTRHEPTGDQRTAIGSLAKNSGEKIHAISIATLYQRICDSERYLQARDKAPFGSIAYSETPLSRGRNVSIEYLDSAGLKVSLTDINERLLRGGRVLFAGDYGVGKSHALRQLYRMLRKDHFRSGMLSPFPVHINLRDCAGLKTPSEILRRHAEEIGFDHPNGLMSAWRAGRCVLILDGFDEIIPTRWLGGAADVRTVRWEALAPIRRLVEETPDSAGIVVAGRSHYFASVMEMTDAIGLKAHQTYSVPDFDEVQLAEFLSQSDSDAMIPDWVPMRPLLLGYLVAVATEDPNALISAGRASGWRKLLEAICVREAKMFQAVRPETIRQIVSRVATLARSRGDATGPVDMEVLRAAFVAVNGRQPDEEGIQLLLRLPGLAIGTADVEERLFVDVDLADTAYGEDLAAYVLDPRASSHPLMQVASWISASADLGTDVAASCVTELGLSVGHVTAAMTSRQNAGQYDAVMADLVRVATHLQSAKRDRNDMWLVSGVYFDELVLGDSDLFSSVTFQDCIIQRLDVSAVDEGTWSPHFQGCLIGMLDGASAVPERLASRFSNCEIERFSVATHTTAGIMQLGLDRDSRIALSIIKKVFGQRGSARKEGALSRGLSLADRPYVPAVLAGMVTQGWLLKSAAGSNILYSGVRTMRPAALSALDVPAEFRFKP